MNDLSPAEQSVVDRFDAAPDAPESLRERVAEAMRDEDGTGRYTLSYWHRLADVAIDAITGGTA